MAADETVGELARQAAEHLAKLAGIISALERQVEGVPLPAPRAAPAVRLTNRENEVLGLLLQGLSNRRIARTLAISEPTVKNHLHAIFLKLGVADRTQAVAKVLGAR